MRRCLMAGFVAPCALGFLMSAAAAQEPCKIEPLTAEALLAGAEALNRNLACIEQRLEALEDQSAQGAAAGGTDAHGPIAEKRVLETIKVSLDYASIVDKTQALLEFSIENMGDKPVLAIIASFQDSSVMLRGEAKSRPFKVQGFATCPTYQTRVTQYCIERTKDETWAVLDPGAVQGFQMSTNASRDTISADTASAKIRLIIREDGEARFQDVSFARIPLAL